MGSKHGMERLEAGQKVHDRQNDTTGVVLEYACQYAHPKADPVYSYLIRWQDGQVQASGASASGSLVNSMTNSLARDSSALSTTHISGHAVTPPNSPKPPFTKSFF